MPATVVPSGSLNSVQGAAAYCGGMVDAEIMQQRGDIARPADRDGRGAHGVFEDEVPADDPGEDLAEGRIGIGVGAAGDRQQRGEFGVAQADEGAGDAAETKDSMMPGPA